MNEDFDKFIKSKTAYDVDRLNKAVASGINRAKSGRIDKAKIFKIVVAAAIVLFITITVEMNQLLNENVRTYFAQTPDISEESSRILINYINARAKVIMEHLQ